MPNHFLTVGLASTDYARMPEDNDDQEERAKALMSKANLCAIIDPLPEELKHIISSLQPCRYVNKKTGRLWEENGDGPLPGLPGQEWELKPLSDEEILALTQKHGAAEWHGWQVQRWGTKWGTYNLKIHKMGGDGRPILVEFQSAWGPPNPAMMRKITDYLEEHLYLKSFKWIGHNPYDDSTSDIEVAPKED